MSSENEQRKLQLEAGERLQSELQSRNERLTALSQEKETELKARTQEHDQKMKILQDKLAAVDAERSKLVQKKYSLESQMAKFQNSLELKEDTIQTHSRDLAKLRSQMGRVENENKSLEKSLHQTQLHVAALEQSNRSQE